MDMQHTKGPWRIDEGAELQEPGFYGAPGDSNGYHAISTDTWRVTGFIGDANAKLIAAAPELLEALETIVARADYCDEESYQDFTRAVHNAGAAIAKATGAA